PNQYAAGGYGSGNGNSNGSRYGPPGGSVRDFDTGSVVSYIPDDVSSIHSSSLGGAGLNTTYPQFFSGFGHETWPGLPGAPTGRSGNRRAARGTESIAGESVANSEYTDASA
ncbi:hypothetical protein BN1708_019715, partial [Verticillium longisporum]